MKPEHKPKSLYTVKILSEADFDRLPYKNAKTSLGAADASTGIAYVRDTGYNDITKHTIAHELDELMAKVSPHEEDGIRYKNLGESFSGFKNAISSAAQPVAKGLGAVAKAPFQIAGAAYNGIKGLAQPGGVFGKFNQKNTGIPTPYGAKTATFPGAGQGPIPSDSLGSNNPFEQFNSASVPPTQTGGGGTPASSGGSAIGKYFKDLFTGQPKTQTQGGGAPASQASTGGGGLLDSFKSAIAPVAVSALGNAFAPKVPTPDFSGIIDPLKQQVSGQGNLASPIRQLAELKLTDSLNTDVNGAPPDALFEQGDRQQNELLTEDLKSLEQAFKAANPNVDIANNSAFQTARDKLIERRSELRTEDRDRVSAQYNQQAKQNRIVEIQTALNLDQAQTSQLIQLAQLQVDQIMLQTGVTYGEAAQLKELFGNLGTGLLQNAFKKGGQT